MTLHTVFRLAFRQAGVLIGSIIGLLGLGLRVQDHTTSSRRAVTLDVPRPGNAGAGGWCRQRAPAPAGGQHGPQAVPQGRVAAGEARDGNAPVVAHAALGRGRRQRPDRGLPLTSKDVDDASQVDPLLDQVPGAVASFAADGAYDQDRVYAGVAERHPEAAVVVPPRTIAVPSDTAESAPT